MRKLTAVTAVLRSSQRTFRGSFFPTVMFLKQNHSLPVGRACLGGGAVGGGLQLRHSHFGGEEGGGGDPERLLITVLCPSLCVSDLSPEW